MKDGRDNCIENCGHLDSRYLDRLSNRGNWNGEFVMFGNWDKSLQETVSSKHLKQPFDLGNHGVNLQLRVVALGGLGEGSSCKSGCSGGSLRVVMVRSTQEKLPYYYQWC